jgi:pimeloyl-ACP methyl ester carboxylesterase
MTRSARRDSTSRATPSYLRWSSFLVCLWLSLTAIGWAQLPEKPPFVQPPTKPPVAQPPAKPGVAQPPKTPATKPPAAKTPTAKPKQEDKPPEPVSMSLSTRDHWQLHCMYYPPQEKIRSGRETVPIILVHGWGGQGSEWNSLAVHLQTLGHASMVVDLRGHGRSTTRRVAGDLTGKTETVRYDDLKTDDMGRLWLDLEAVKSELRKKNDAGEVNLEMLTVIAAEEGCIVALEWAVRDWSWPPTLQGRQGQDVQALILLSPIESFRRMNASKDIEPRYHQEEAFVAVHHGRRRQQVCEQRPTVA